MNSRAIPASFKLRIRDWLTLAAIAPLIFCVQLVALIGFAWASLRKRD